MEHIDKHVAIGMPYSRGMTLVVGNNMHSRLCDPHLEQVQQVRLSLHFRLGFAHRVGK